MRYITQQKPKTLLFLLVFAVAFLTVGLHSKAVFATALQPPGTCFMTIQGAGQKIGPCTKVAPGVRNNNGKPDTHAGTPLDPTKCYDISEGLSSQSIAEVQCDDTSLPGTNTVQMCVDDKTKKNVPCQTCQDGTLAPENDSKKCGAGLGTGVAPVKTKYQCGDDGSTVYVSIDLGCKGKGNSIADLLFGIIRFLSIGVGLVIVGSMVYAGIQYTTSRGDPQATAKAIGRIRANVIALLIFAFAYAILNYVIPGQVLK